MKIVMYDSNGDEFITLLRSGPGWQNQDDGELFGPDELEGLVDECLAWNGGHDRN